MQIDEPALVLDLNDHARRAFETAYGTLSSAIPGLKLLLTTYFGAIGDNLDMALRLPVAGLQLDLVCAPAQLEDVLAKAPTDLVLSLGVVDGRNIWRTDLNAVLDRIEPVVKQRGADKVMLAPSCSLLHVPVDLDLESELDEDLKSWLAFAVQKISELATLSRALGEGRGAVKDALATSARTVAARNASPKIHDPAVQKRMAAISPDMARRHEHFEVRRRLQRDRLSLPPFPNHDHRLLPADRRGPQGARGAMQGHSERRRLRAFLEDETEDAVRWQEEIGIDVLVHGEFERNDMVQYFGEQLAGFAFTQHGWVQSYGSRYVRPPIIFGDVSRPQPMTVAGPPLPSRLPTQPMKGMLTGPVTILQWSFVRDDQPRSETCRQIALASGTKSWISRRPGSRIIQIDEPAIREGLPLRQAEWRAISTGRWSVSGSPPSGVADETQIHTHMCYCEFNDIIDAIAALDADVISIETARSRMELLDAFTDLSLSERDRPGRLRHSCAALSKRRRDGGASRQGEATSFARSDMGQSGLRPEDP